MMASIDWSDPEEMLGLLAEYVADEIAANRDRDRASFLEDLRSDLGELIAADDFAANAVEVLRRIDAAQPREFRDDVALAHLRDCIEELERIG